MPPKKGKIIVKKDDNNKKTKDIKKKLEELSLKSQDDDSIDQDDYETETFSDEATESTVNESDNENESENLNETSDNEDEEETEESDETEEVDKEKDNDDEEVGEDDEECMYKKAKVKNLDEDDDEADDFEEVYDDDNINYNEVVKPEDRITKPFMTIFERVRLLGDRAKQLSLGAKPMIQGIETMNPKEIAKLELEKGVIPLIIERPLPNGKKERWHVTELKIMN